MLVVVTRAALREKQYAAVMAATGLLYLAILTAFGMDLVARAILSLIATSVLGQLATDRAVPAVGVDVEGA